MNNRKKLYLHVEKIVYAYGGNSICLLIKSFQRAIINHKALKSYSEKQMR